MLGERFSEALVFANELHGGHLRKGTRIPYMAHLLTVSALVLEAGGTEQEAIAALLHDAVEDQGGEPTLDKIRDRFGGHIADLVDECTETLKDPKPPWKERKLEYIAHMAKASPSARLISCADKLHNIRSLLTDFEQLGDALWSRFNARKEETLWFYQALVSTIRDAGESRPIIFALEREVAHLVDIVS
ncbi:MAG: HD domain-containing protein [Nitrospinales bacterium]